MAVRDRGVTTLAFRSPAPQPCHLRRQPTFVDEDQVLGIEIGLALDPCLARRFDIGALLLAGVSGLFLCVKPRRLRNFHTAV